MAPRLAERERERRAVRRRKVLRSAAAWTGGLGVLAGVVWLVFFSSVLGVDADEIEVTTVGDATYVDTDAVEQVVTATAGTPLPRLDTVGLRDAVREVRGVDDVRILRAWPRGVDVRVEPQVPVAAVPVGEAFRLLDASGATVASVGEPPGDLPRVDVPVDDEDGGPGTRALRSVLVVLNALPPDILADVTDVSADTQDAVETELRDGSTVRWGGAEDAELKVDVLRVLLDGVDPDGVTVYDVSAPEAPVTS
ncbi:cell division protein FtsQ [Paraoerskovia sediminicola]|uniref:Cell division protein FtsQ n=1 Tax=Paraoerskovia sediminicola TaxID=1138587 RepID=A0ABN6XG92_9CELL|nr:cell division protein FtsQ/DivIB [Paraoerskovia sediminicola]BDZ43836.1 cell division protein FtsQ [Paraoerskovia sediminicola]